MDHSVYLVRVKVIKPCCAVVGEKITVEGTVCFCKRKQLEKKGFQPSGMMSVYEAGGPVINRPVLYADIYDKKGEFFDTQTFIPRADGTFSFSIDTRGYPEEGGRYSFGAFYGTEEDGRNLMRSNYFFDVFSSEVADKEENSL